MEYLNFCTVFFYLSLCTQVQVAQQMESSISQWQITQQRLLVDSKSEFQSCSHMWGEGMIVNDNSVCVRVCSVPQSCPALCDPMDCSLPGSSIHGVVQARILEWVAIFSSRGSYSPGIKPSFPASATLAGSFFSAEPSGKKMCWVLQRQMDLAIRGHCTHFRNVSQSVGSRISTFQIQIMLLTETGDNVSVSPLWPLVRSLKGTWLSSVQAACSGYMVDSYWNTFLRCWHLW